MTRKRTYNGFGARSLGYCDGCGCWGKIVFDTERKQWLDRACYTAPAKSAQTLPLVFEFRNETPDIKSVVT